MRGFLLGLMLVGVGVQQAPQQGPGSGAAGMTPVDQARGDAILAKTATSFLKFHAAYEDVRANDKLIKNVVLVEAGNKGPAFASPNGVIRIDLSYLENPKPNFDDNRLIVVLYHEIGHLHYFVTVPKEQWTSDRSEQAAFEYSLLKTKEMAEKGDCGPLKTGVHFMKLRSEGTNLDDPHVRALKRIVTEPLYAGYVKYVGETKACQAVTVGRE